MADRGLIEANNDLTPVDKAKQLIALAGVVEKIAKSDSMKGPWLDFQQRLSSDIARISPTEQAIKYRTERSEQITRLIRWHEARDDNVDSMVHRKHAVNRVLLGVLFERLDQQQQARECWLDSLKSFEGMLKTYPLNSQTRADCFETLLLVANLDWTTNHRESAIDLYSRALSQIHVLVQTNPQDHELTRRSSQVHELVGQRYLEAGDAKAAGEAFGLGADLAGALEGNSNILDWGVRESDRALSVRLLQQAAEAYEVAGMPVIAISKREELSRLNPGRN